MTGQPDSIYNLPLFLPGDPPYKYALRVAEAVTEAVDEANKELEEFVLILCRHLRAFADRFPAMRDPLSQMLKDVYAEARPT